MSPTKHTLRPPSTSPGENEITLQEWNRQLKEHGLLIPGSTIAQAQNAQHGWLIVECAGCGRTAHSHSNRSDARPQRQSRTYCGT